MSLIQGHCHQLLVLLLALLLMGGSSHAFAAAGPPSPNENGTARQKDRELVDAVARAAALYGQFRSSEALVEIKKALALAPDDPEVLVWTARTYIDVGDMIPETVSEWPEKRQEQYRTAERYARAAVKADPGSHMASFLPGRGIGKGRQVFQHQAADSHGP